MEDVASQQAAVAREKATSRENLKKLMKMTQEKKAADEQGAALQAALTESASNISTMSNMICGPKVKKSSWFSIAEDKLSTSSTDEPPITLIGLF